MLIPDAVDQIVSDNKKWHKNEIIPGFVSYSLLQKLTSPAPFRWFDQRKVLETFYNRLHTDGLYLNIGCGENTLHDRVCNIDVVPSTYTDLVCDGRHLPLEDNSVDGVFVLLVLEHVPDPFAVVDEILRVLKEDGFVLATIPFLQVLHENPRDYYRFTPDGFRRLFKNFDEIALEVASGPSGTLIWILKEYFALLCPFSNNGYVYAAVREIMGWLLYPLIVLDYYLLKKNRAYKMASFFYYHGQKRRTP